MREQLVGAAEAQAASRRWGHWRWAFTIEQDFPSWVGVGLQMEAWRREQHVQRHRGLLCFRSGQPLVAGTSGCLISGKNFWLVF